MLLCEFKVNFSSSCDFVQVADWFDTLAMAEKSHAGRFQRALKEMHQA